MQQKRDDAEADQLCNEVRGVKSERPGNFLDDVARFAGTRRGGCKDQRIRHISKKAGTSLSSCLSFTGLSPGKWRRTRCLPRRPCSEWLERESSLRRRDCVPPLPKLSYR